jgi:hypothetical protein
MGATHGIAGVAGVSLRPEVNGIFLLDSEDEVEWFAHMGLEQGHEAVDVWEVSLADDTQFEESDEGYHLVAKPIPPEAIRLHTANWTSRDPANVADDLFHEIYYGEGDLKSETLSDNAVVFDADGREHRGPDAIASWARSRAHGPPPVPEPRADGKIVFEISSDSGGYTIEGLDADRCLLSPPTDTDFWTVALVQDNRVIEVREYRSRDEALSAAGVSDIG